MFLSELYKIKVPLEKLTNYLLNNHHPDGWSKASFFNKMGIVNAELLREIIEDIVLNNPVVAATDSPFGKKFIVDGTYTGIPNKRFRLRTVWIVLAETEICTFITAYPL